LETQELNRLGVNQRTRLEVFEDHDSALLSWVQDDPAIRGVTESLYSHRVIPSC